MDINETKNLLNSDNSSYCLLCTPSYRAPGFPETFWVENSKTGRSMGIMVRLEVLLTVMAECDLLALVAPGATEFAGLASIDWHGGWKKHRLYVAASDEAAAEFADLIAALQQLVANANQLKVNFDRHEMWHPGCAAA